MGVVVLVPGAWNRTFTLREPVRRGERIGFRCPVQTWQTGKQRWESAASRSGLLRDLVLDDPTPPLRGPPRADRIVSSEIRSAGGVMSSWSRRPFPG